MNVYDYFRTANAVMALWSALAYCYIDAHAPRQFIRGERRIDGSLIMPKGKFISRIGRIVFLLATVNGTTVAIIHDTPGGQQTLGIFFGLFCVSTGCAWMVLDEWRERHPKASEV